MVRWALLRSLAEGPEALGVAIAGKRPAAVFELLLLHAGATLTTERIIDELWPDSPPRSARNSVQRFVADVRAGLGDRRELLVTTGEGYRLDVDRTELDVHAVELLRAAAVDARDPAETSRLLADALSLVPDVLPEHGPTPSGEQFRRRWAEERVVLLEQRVEADLAAGRAADLIGELVQLVELHPYREGLWGQLMRAFAAEGRQAESLRCFGRLRARLVEDLGIEPSSEMRRLELQILSGTDRPRPPATPTAPATRDRAEQTVAARRVRPVRLIGRDGEMEHLVELVHAGEVVSVVGPGGVGKTVLATEAARRVHDHSTVVRLTETDHDEEVIALLVGSLGIDTSAQRIGDLAAEIADELRLRPRPVVLDNAEHVLDGATEAVLLLVEHTDVAVIVTSRTPLEVPDERVLRLRPLSVPTVGSEGSSDAERVLLDKAARQGVTLGADDAATVADICRRLDGLPLALELAAAQLGHLAPADLLHRLQESNDLLARNRGAERRHGSLRSLMAWSWDRLDLDERELLRRLAMFRTAVDLTTVEVLGGASDTLRSLVAQSLLVAEGNAGAVHYSMLEIVRRFVVAGIAEPEQQRHYRELHAATVLECLRSHHRAELARWSDAMRAVVPLRGEVPAALDHLDADGRLDDVIDVTARLAPLWSQLGPGAELQYRSRRLEELTQHAELTAPQQSAVLFARIEAAFQRGNLAAVVGAAEELDAHERSAPTDLGILARSFYGYVGFSHALDPRFEGIVEQAYEDALLTEPAMLNRAHVRQWLGCCQLARRDMAAAEESFRASLSATDRHGGIIWSELGLVTTLLLDGRIDDAVTASADVRTRLEDTGWAYAVELVGAIVLANLGYVAEARQRLVDSARSATGEHLVGRRDDHQIAFGVVARLAGEHELADELLAEPCPRNPVTAPLLVAHLTADPVADGQWNDRWCATLPARAYTSGSSGGPLEELLVRWHPQLQDR